jgi:hypothetical protein
MSVSKIDNQNPQMRTTAGNLSVRGCGIALRIGTRFSCGAVLKLKLRVFGKLNVISCGKRKLSRPG